MSVITLLSDFGTRDAYVGSMKGVILQTAPEATLVDITHEIEPQNIVQAAFVWRQAVPWFPAGTIHVAVVDPGVGSKRRLLAAKAGGHILLAPDNGLMTLLLAELALEELRVIENRRFMLPRVSSTFHGRDILGPVAGHLARGTVFRDLGAATDRAHLLNLPKPTATSDFRVTGSILYTDRFGNLITNISRNDLLPTFRNRMNVKVSLNGQALGPVHNAYHEVPAGEVVVLFGSTELLEIAVNGGNARALLNPQADWVIEVG